jgi:hypothetical protein
MAIFLAFFVPNHIIYNLLILKQFLIGMTGLVKNWPKTADFNRNIPLQFPLLSREMDGAIYLHSPPTFFPGFPQTPLESWKLSNGVKMRSSHLSHFLHLESSAVAGA